MNSEPNPSVSTGRLARKLAHILREIGKVEKTGHNAFHRYDYVTENDLVYAVRGKLAEQNIFVFTSTESQRAEVIETGEGKKTLLTTVTTKHTFVDGDSGEEFSVLSQGQGSDNGDKGGYKAITGAMKYFLYKCFMIPTGDDPEGDEKTDQRHQSSPQSNSPTSSASASRPAQTAASKGPEVPRDAHVTEEMRAQFRNGNWNAVRIHFGKNKGVALEKLETKSLKWYIENFVPKGWVDDKNKTHPPSQDDILLRAALDVADEEEELGSV